MESLTSGIVLGVAGSYLLGLVLVGIIWPYVNARLENPGLPFEWRMIISRILGSIFGFIPVLLSASAIAQLEELADVVVKYGWAGYLLAFLVAAGSAYGGREVQKSYNGVQTRRKNGNGLPK